MPVRPCHQHYGGQPVLGLGLSQQCPGLGLELPEEDTSKDKLHSAMVPGSHRLSGQVCALGPGGIAVTTAIFTFARPRSLPILTILTLPNAAHSSSSF